MFPKTFVAVAAFAASTGFVFDAFADCASGGGTPSASEISELRTGLVTMRRRADVAARQCLDLRQQKTARKLSNLASKAVELNGATYDPGLTCSSIVTGKGEIREKLEEVHEAASEYPSMSLSDQNAVLGPVDDAAEDYFASAGTPTFR